MADNVVRGRFGYRHTMDALKLVEPRWWSQALGVSEQQLRAALEAANGSFNDIGKYLPK